MSRLIGAAPGYVGFEEGGKVSETFFIVPDANESRSINRGCSTEALWCALFLIASLRSISVFFFSAVVLLDELEKAHKVNKSFHPSKNYFCIVFRFRMLS